MVRPMRKVKTMESSNQTERQWHVAPYLIRLGRETADRIALHVKLGDATISRAEFANAGAAFQAFYAEIDARKREVARAKAPKHSAPLFAPIQKVLPL